METAGIHYTALCQPCWLQCELCEKIFPNRYSLIQHNAAHIIIPLIKQTHQCPDCLRHFHTEEYLNLHNCKAFQLPRESTDNVLEMLQTKPLVNCEDTVKICDSEYEDDYENGEDVKGFEEAKETFVKPEYILHDVIHKQVLVKCESEFKDLLAQCQEINNSSSIISENVAEDIAETVIEADVDCPKEPVKNRLLFEDDEDEIIPNPMHNSIQNAFINNKNERSNVVEPTSQINHQNRKNNKGYNNLHAINLLENNINSVPLSSKFNSLNTDPMQWLNSQVNLVENNNSLLDEAWQKQTVHYDDLIEPQEAACPHCSKNFPNRFQLIEHEALHLAHRRFRYSLCGYCETYLNGTYKNLHRHIQEKHPLKPYKKFSYQRCKICHLLYYNKIRHLEKYHYKFKCEKCYSSFKTKEVLETHECPYLASKLQCSKCNHFFKTDLSLKCHNCVALDVEKESSKEFEKTFKELSILKLCELCYSFMKIYIHNRTDYVEIGELSKLGCRQVCDKCNNKFFVVYLLKRKVMNRVKHKVQGTPHHKVITNTDRLKRVQQRLRMIQHRNKF